MNCRRNNRAFTLVEVMVTLGIITTLSALLLPAVQSAREASRRSACQNNVHQIALALQSFESQHGHFPVGSRCQRLYPSGLSTIGISWWVEILPYLEQAGLRNQMDVSGPYCGWVPLHPRNGHLVDGVSVGPVRCPSTPFQPFALTSGSFRVAIPSYVGVSGAADGDGFVDTRGRKATSNYGDFSGSGVLLPNEFTKQSKITDGASKTLIVSEISDNLFYQQVSQPIVVDASHNWGWLCGTIASGTLGAKQYSGGAAANITTVRYPIGTREYGLPGINTQGANNPLRSAHTGGAMSANVDGSVVFLGDNTDLLTLKRLATRDDDEFVER